MISSGSSEPIRKRATSGPPRRTWGVGVSSETTTFPRAAGKFAEVSWFHAFACPLDDGDEPILKRFIEDAMPRADLQDNFTLSGKALAC